jgi:hypothetical protein
VRTGARIYAEPAVLERAGVEPGPGDVDDDEDEGTAEDRIAGSVLERRTERTGADRIVDPRLDVFRDFINSLGSDQGGESREGPGGT